MQTGIRTTRVSVLVEKPDGTVQYVTWTTRGSIKALHAKVRREYAERFPGAKIRFGNALCSWHYGAH